MPGSKRRYLFIHKVKTGVHIMEISSRDLKILEKNGWVFVETQYNANHLNSDPGLRRGDGTLNSVSCVVMARRALGIRNPFIFTPDQLYRYLTK
jgi:hypothetical protein